MGYTHNRGFSIKGGSSEGYAVGSKGSERKIINSSGIINLPAVDKAGAPALTSVGTQTGTSWSIASATTVTATITVTSGTGSTAVTNTIPANHFIKWKPKVVAAAGAVISAWLQAVTPSGSTLTVASDLSNSTTTLSAASTVVVATPVPAGSTWKQKAKVTLAASATTSKAMSVLTLSLQKMQPVYLGTVS